MMNRENKLALMKDRLQDYQEVRRILSVGVYLED